MAKLFIEDLEVAGQRVLVRVDFNVPLDENQVITSDKRIIASLPTIKYLVEKGAKVILMSHLGRPKGKRIPAFSLKPVAEDLKTRFEGKVSFIEDCIGSSVTDAVSSMSNGDILLLENLRYYKEETENDSAFAESLASIADLYVNDAFGTSHRAHASTEGVTKFIDKCASGYLIKKEIDFIGGALENPEKPFVAILGGAKISGKIDVVTNLIGKVDTLIIGGGMAYTFVKAQGGKIGISLCEDDKMPLALEILEKAKKAGTKLLLPLDSVTGTEFSNTTTTLVCKTGTIPDEREGMDIGPETRELFANEIKNAKTVIWNGPMGVFEFDNFAIGTNVIAAALAEATDNGATSIIGGGDSASAIEKAGLENRISHISTGGGASLEFLEGKKLPGIEALSEV